MFLQQTPSDLKDQEHSPESRKHNRNVSCLFSSEQGSTLNKDRLWGDCKNTNENIKCKGDFSKEKANKICELKFKTSEKLAFHNSKRF